MNNEVQVFNNQEFGDVRTVVIDDEPWFVGKDVAKALGYGDGNNESKALANAIKDHVDEEDKRLLSYEDFKGCQNGDLKNISHYGAYVINESGMYALIFGSKLESAKRFKRWVTHEVLPSLRKTGRYSVNQESDIDTIINGLVAASRVIRQKDEEIRLLKSNKSPKEEIYVCDMADRLNSRGLFNGGANLFYRWNREHGLVLKNSTFPTEKALRLGILRVDVRRNYRYNGVVIPRKRTVVTPKGQKYYLNVFSGGANL